MKTLIIMRHAQAGNASRDFDRPLSPHGQDQAKVAGGKLADAVGHVDQLYVSSAKRTQETLAGLERGGLTFGDVESTEDIYYGGQDDVLELIRGTGDVEVVMVLGHEPTQSGVASYLSNGETEQARSLGHGFPTAGIAIFDIYCPWADIEMSAHELREFIGR